LVASVRPRPLEAAIRAPWGTEPALRAAVAALRRQGQTVVCALAGPGHEVDEFHCDRELVKNPADGAWIVRNL
ncbi:MAG TPA: ATP phosphoribosyltransferase regulatory subunit, partial [Comamonadaceae bacterium]|nr:ATP phosphoribosyltransferase regulatory subunit [Comamonadaceae bacterium]